MTNQLLKTFGAAAVIAQCVVLVACSSSTPAGGGLGGNTAGASGTSGGSGGGGGSVLTITIDPAHPGSCVAGVDNPDFAGTGACAPDCQSVSCGRACSQDCCVTCGIDAKGLKFCSCRTQGVAYANCTCQAPANIPPGLMGGPCSPVGDSRAMPPVGADMAIRGMPCKSLNLVCFTSDSMSSSERGCICQDDGGGVLTLHCGSVNHWFTNNGVTTIWTP